MINDVQILHRMKTANMLTFICRHVRIIRPTIVPALFVVSMVYLFSSMGKHSDIFRDESWLFTFQHL